MSRDVCGICWCPYDDDGRCGCEPVRVIDPAELDKVKQITLSDEASQLRNQKLTLEIKVGELREQQRQDEALMQQALVYLERSADNYPVGHALSRIAHENTIAALKDRLK